VIKEILQTVLSKVLREVCFIVTNWQLVLCIRTRL